MKLGIHSDQSTFGKLLSYVKGSSKVNEQIIDKDNQFTFKGEDGTPHDIMLIKLSQEVSAKIPTIKLPAVECTKPEMSHQIHVGGFGATKTSGKGEKHLRH